jgi:DNA-3-methyladenine glycosylase
VAPDLLGRVLVRRLDDGQDLAGRIVECEAYQEDDPASHSFRGRTLRTDVMFGPPGHLYVYLSYGVNWCCNVVTGEDGEGSAVLLRAVEPLEGIERMREHRGGWANERLLCAGPGRLTQAMAISRENNGEDLVEGDRLWISAGTGVHAGRVIAGKRVGLTVARDQPWRFVEEGSRFLSRAARHLESVRAPDGSARLRGC